MSDIQYVWDFLPIAFAIHLLKAYFTCIACLSILRKKGNRKSLSPNKKKLYIDQLRARRALSIYKDVPLRTRRALYPYNVYGNSTLLDANISLLLDLALCATLKLRLNRMLPRELRSCTMSAGLIFNPVTRGINTLYSALSSISN